MRENKHKKGKKDPLKEIIKILEEYEKDTPKMKAKDTKSTFDSCRCGTPHGDEQDTDPDEAYHLRSHAENVDESEVTETKEKKVKTKKK
ncbi:hypothetical protein HYY69_02400 [Candidatus Woesearchaeota archaeon]|nr:hypothetical protein [Candidatus Woesearchaeota archaeon]